MTAPRRRVTYVCPGCQRRTRVREARTTHRYCDCHPRAPFRLVNAAHTAIVDAVLKRTRRVTPPPTGGD